MPDVVRGVKMFGSRPSAVRGSRRKTWLINHFGSRRIASKTITNKWKRTINGNVNGAVVDNLATFGASHFEVEQQQQSAAAASNDNPISIFGEGHNQRLYWYNTFARLHCQRR